VLGGGEWSASCPTCFTLGERAPGTHWIVCSKVGQGEEIKTSSANNFLYLCSLKFYIEMDLRETRWYVVDKIHLAQDRGFLVNTVTNIQVP